MEVRIADLEAAKRVLHENYCKTTGLSENPEQFPAEATLDAGVACPACGALTRPEQRQCPDCGIRLA